MGFKLTGGKSMVVYKYLTAERFSSYMENYLRGEVYFADWHAFNDKKEGKYKCCSSILDCETLAKLKEQIKKAKCKLLKVCSMAQYFDIYRMWDLYANHHSGVCVAINIDQSKAREIQDGDFLEENKCGYKNVTYCKDIKQPLNDNPDELALKILSTKLKCWEGEHEVRFFRNSLDRGMFSIGDVTHIYLGANFCDVDLYQKLAEYMDNSNICDIKVTAFDLRHEGNLLKSGKVKLGF
jgi:hypothetical protein